MEYTFTQIDQLADILEAEITGGAVDVELGCRLAEQLAWENSDSNVLGIGATLRDGCPS